MHDDPEGWENFVYMLAIAFAASGTGRIVWHLMEVREKRRKLLNWGIFLEIFIALMMAILSVGVAVYNEWPREVLAAAACLLGYLGPKGLQFWGEWYLAQRKNKKGGNNGT